MVDLRPRPHLTSPLLSSPPLLNSPHISSSPTYLIPSLLNNLHYRSLPPSLELHGYGNHGSILSSISPSPEIQTCTLHRQSSLLQTTKHVFQSSLFCQSSLNAPPGVDKLISSRSSPQSVAALGSVSTAERTQQPMTRPSRRSCSYLMRCCSWYSSCSMCPRASALASQARCSPR